MNVLKIRNGQLVSVPYLCPNCGGPMIVFAADEHSTYRHTKTCPERRP